MRSPEKIEGSAAGASTRRSVAHRLPSRVRITRSSSGSTEARPSMVFTTMGKKQISVTTISFGVMV